MNIDRSEGYDGVADQFMAARRAVGASFVRRWARENLPRAASIIDIGCGSGVPIAQALATEGFDVFGIDASPKMISEFRRRSPTLRCACEAVQDSAFFHRRFDAAVAIGLLFLLSAPDQARVIRRIAAALTPAGRLLFNAPRRRCAWRDTLTGRLSTSLGALEYSRLLGDSGLHVVRCHQDDGGNDYFDAAKPRL